MSLLTALKRPVVLLLLLVLAACAGPSDQDYASRIAHGRELLEQQRPLEALETFARAQRRYPDRRDPYAFIARICEQQGRPQRAIPILERALQRGGPEPAMLHFLLGMLQQSADRRDEAERSYREAIRLAPELEPAHAKLAEFLMRNLRLEDALDLLREAVGRFPRQSLLRLQYAEALLRSGQLSEAERITRGMLRLVEPPNEAHYLMGLIHLQKEENALARHELERATILGLDDFQTWYQLANACDRLGDAEARDSALKRFEVLYRQALASAGAAP